jgi:hypothetical protein
MIPVITGATGSPVKTISEDISDKLCAWNYRTTVLGTGR